MVKNTTEVKKKGKVTYLSNNVTNWPASVADVEKRKENPTSGSTCVGGLVHDLTPCLVT